MIQIKKTEYIIQQHNNIWTVAETCTNIMLVQPNEHLKSLVIEQCLWTFGC